MKKHLNKKNRFLKIILRIIKNNTDLYPFSGFTLVPWTSVASFLAYLLPTEKNGFMVGSSHLPSRMDDLLTNI